MASRISSRCLPIRTYAAGLPIRYSRSHRIQYSTESVIEAPGNLNEAERKIFSILRDELGPSKLEVRDISGGCGSMYALDIVSEKFKGLPIVKQHRMVNQVLGEEIKRWHGVQLKTKAP